MNGGMVVFRVNWDENVFFIKMMMDVGGRWWCVGMEEEEDLSYPFSVKLELEVLMDVLNSSSIVFNVNVFH